MRFSARFLCPRVCVESGEEAGLDQRAADEQKHGGEALPLRRRRRARKSPSAPRRPLVEAARLAPAELLPDPAHGITGTAFLRRRDPQRKRIAILQTKPLPSGAANRGQPPGAFVLPLFSLQGQRIFLFRRSESAPHKQRIRSQIHPPPQTALHKNPPGRHSVGHLLEKYVVWYNETVALLDRAVCSGYNKQEEKSRKKKKDESALDTANAPVSKRRISVLRLRLPHRQARRSLPALRGKDEGCKVRPVLGGRNGCLRRDI